MSDTRKAPLDLVPLKALVGASRVLQHGNSRPKPGTNEPRKPGDFIERELGGNFYASLLRHVMDMQELHGVVTPETLARRDRDSSLPVIDHVICNAIIIRAMLIRDGLLPVDPGLGHSVKEGDWRALLSGMESKPTREAIEKFFRDAEGENK